MDPDANLTEQRRLVQRIQVATNVDADTTEDAERLAELVEALDHWLSRGGFLPKAWKR